jgi:hypothetical protein
MAQKNVGRVLANEAEVVAVLKKGNLIDVNVVDTAKMSYYDQLKVRATVFSLSVSCTGSAVAGGGKCNNRAVFVIVDTEHQRVGRRTRGRADVHNVRCGRGRHLPIPRSL